MTMTGKFMGKLKIMVWDATEVKMVSVLELQSKKGLLSSHTSSTNADQVLETHYLPDYDLILRGKARPY